MSRIPPGFSRFLLPLAVFAALVFVLAVGVKRSPEKGTLESALIGRMAPEFELPDLRDPSRKVSSRDYRGRWYVVNVWGTWCPGCRVEHNVLLDVRRSGLVPIIGVNLRDEQSQALGWLSQLGDPYEVVVMDTDGRTSIDFGVYGAPETFLINPQGIVMHRHVGPLTHEAWQRDFAARINGNTTPPSS